MYIILILIKEYPDNIMRTLELLQNTVISVMNGDVEKGYTLSTMDFSDKQGKLMSKSDQGVLVNRMVLTGSRKQFYCKFRAV